MCLKEATLYFQNRVVPLICWYYGCKLVLFIYYVPVLLYLNKSHTDANVHLGFHSKLFYAKWLGFPFNSNMKVYRGLGVCWIVYVCMCVCVLVFSDNKDIRKTKVGHLKFKMLLFFK